MGDLAKVNDIDIWWEDFGDSKNPTVVLIMGAYTNSQAWPMSLINLLIQNNYHVVRFDNRDSGKSTWFEKRNFFENLIKFFPSFLLKYLIRYVIQSNYKKSPNPKTVKSPYDLNDMANDVIALMKYLKIEKAHLVGASMGGLIAQTIALNNPELVSSLTLMVTSPGIRDERLSKPDPIFLDGMTESVLMMIKNNQKEAMLKTFKASIGSRFSYDDVVIEELFNMVDDHGTNTYAFHSKAIEKTPSYLDKLKNIKAPTLIINGSEDPLIPIDHGFALSEGITNSELFVMEGVGHELPEELMNEISTRMLKIFKS